MFLFALRDLAVLPSSPNISQENTGGILGEHPLYSLAILCQQCQILFNKYKYQAIE